MNDEQKDIPRDRPERRWKRALIVLAGIVATQVLLYGPSLIGSRILLPLDILATPDCYLPLTPAVKEIVPQDPVLSDLAFMFEPARRFAASEIQAGRVPLWTTYQFAGSPFIWPKYSPFLLLAASTPSPVIIAWVQLFEAVVAGLGAYFFFRRVLGVSFWAATIPAWCYPMTGFFVLWQGYPTCSAVYWLPWLFFAVRRAVEKRTARSMAALSLVTCLVVISGHFDVAAQVLLGSGLFAIWCVFDIYAGEWLSRKVARALVVLTVGWGLGFCLAAPHVFPMVEYVRTGTRMQNRTAGKEDRPPIGLPALPQIVVPDCYGSSQHGSLPLLPEREANLVESPAAGYAGAIAVLLVAPLAWCNRRYLSVNIFWVLLAFFGISWCLNVPLLVQLLRLPGLNLMSHNRLVLLTAFAILAMTAVGLDVLRQKTVQWRRWFWVPALVSSALMSICFVKATTVPEDLGFKLEAMLLQGTPPRGVDSLEEVRQVQGWFAHMYYIASLTCGLGGIGWLLLYIAKWRSWLMPAMGLLLVGDLLWFASGRSPQCDPALYYPRIPALEQIARAGPGRVFGYKCLPATLAQTHGLSDVRGYDSVDPGCFIELMALVARSEEPTTSTPYAFTFCMGTPLQLFTPDQVRLSPILDMLGVRYVIFRGVPPPQIRPAFQSPDYWVLVNASALPRIFVPERVETAADRRIRLEKLAAPDFDGRKVAYVETPLNLPAACRGAGEISKEIPTCITISARMETEGMVVLADLWDKGWHAHLNGKEVPVLRVNHALRGVVVPAGISGLEFRYWPRSLTIGLWLSGFAALFLLVQIGLSFRRTQRLSAERRIDERVNLPAIH